MDESSLYIMFSIIFIWLIGITVFLIVLKSNFTLLGVLGKLINIVLRRKGYDEKEEVEKIMHTTGYDYDISQDIFYSREDAWQKSYGYCRLYDESAPAFGMIMDSEPIYFEYDNKKWLIEFWKGQYGMCTGGEVGVYQAKKEKIDFNELFNSTFYDAMDDKTDIKIKFALYKNNKKLFTREGKYWWVTGFKLGEYSEPRELSMKIEITLENKMMLSAFLKGLRIAGYFDEEFEVEGNTVKIYFEEPKTMQPHSRIEKMDNLQQIKNKESCKRYNYIISPELNSFENLVRLKEIESDMYEKILDLSKSHELVEVYKSAKKYIE